MKFKSEHMTQASGSIAGVTYGRAKGGTLYRRARAIPVNPATMYQGQVRNALAALVERWEELSQAERDAWNLYGENVLVTNKLGDQIPLSGQNWFIACNTPRLQWNAKFIAATFPRVDAAPTLFNRGDFSTVEMTQADSSTGIDITFDVNDPWVSIDEAGLILYMGRPRNQGRNAFKGPWRQVSAILGDSTTPETSPFTVSAGVAGGNGWPLIANQRISMMAQLTLADGRLTSRRLIGDVIIT